MQPANSRSWRWRSATGIRTLTGTIIDGFPEEVVGGSGKDVALLRFVDPDSGSTQFQVLDLQTLEFGPKFDTPRGNSISASGSG